MSQETVKAFLESEEIHELGITDRLVAQLWWHHHHSADATLFSTLVAEDKEAGYPAINSSRARNNLRADKRTISSDQGKTFKLQVRAVKALDAQYLSLIESRPLPKSDTLFEDRAFQNTRGYIENVIKQINLSYDYRLYDCCAVMIRRLLETLIIEVYEKLGRAEELKNKDGNFMMFSGLLSFLKADAGINLGRQTVDGLEGFKRIADSSAHNRRFNASKKNIDDKMDGVKLAVVELRQMAFDK